MDNVLLSSARDIISRFVTGSSNVSKKLKNAKASTLPQHEQLVWALTDSSRQFIPASNGEACPFLTYSEIQQLADFFPLCIKQDM